MDLNDVISMARKNKKEASNKMKIGYSTATQAPKKMVRNVNPAAVKAFLDRKKKEEENQMSVAAKKKDALQRLREDAKHTKKANAMARRTKDNLQIYRGEDYLGLHKKDKKDDVELSPEAEMRHQAFMRKIEAQQTARGMFKRPKNNDNYSSDEEDKRRMFEKNRKKASKVAAGLNFNELLRLAQKQKPNNCSSSEDDSSASDSDDSSDSGLTPEEKYQRERRKRKELEARMKGKPIKRKSSDKAAMPSFKIGKLDSGLSEESKRMKVQALMAKFKKNKPQDGAKDSRSPKASPAPSNGFKRPSNGDTRRPSSKDGSLRKRDKTKRPLDNVKKLQQSKIATSSQSQSSKSLKRQGQPSGSTTNGVKKQSNGGGSGMAKKTNPYLEMMKKKQKELGLQKGPSYAEMLAKAQSNASKKPPAAATQCKLSVTSQGVRTNYPGVAQDDVKRRSNKHQSRPPPNGARPRSSAAEEYRRRALTSGHVRTEDVARVHRRAQLLGDDFDEESDEYDSDMEGFIADEQEEQEIGGAYGADISAAIGAIFGYNKNKYGRESEYELSKMDASYKDIQSEEKRSLRIAQIEDAREAKLEEERMKRRKKR